MRDDNYITSRRDIRNRRYRQRRRQIMLNRVIFAGILIIIVLVGTIFGVKACRNKDSGQTAVTDNNNSNNSDNNGGTDEGTGDEGGENNSSEEQTTEEETTEEETTEEETTDGETTVTEKPDYATDGNRIVCVDAGHGGEDSGSVGADGTLEKQDTLKMAKALKAELESRGITVYMTREDDSWVTKDERINKAASVKADLLLSVHRNEYAADTGVRGFEAWVHSSKPADATDVANRIQSALTAVGITRDRGVKFGSQGSATEDYYINNHSKGPSCLLEMGFMTNAEDNSLFRNKTNVLAAAMADAIVDWMDAQGL